MLLLGICGAASPLARAAPNDSPVDPLMITGAPGPAGPVAGQAPAAPTQNWNLHLQNTDILQGDPGFPARYSGVNSLNKKGEVDETVTLDLFGGVRLWPGAEAHIDGLLWEGYGLSQTHGIEAFPNGDAFKAGTGIPNYIVARLFIRQTLGLGGEQEAVPDDQLTLGGRQDISRLTLTIGRFSPTDIADHNTYAQDQHTQFMNWAMMGNLAWDYGQDTVGFTTGVAAELNQPDWALRYGFFQMPAEKNGFTSEDQFLKWPARGSDGQFWRSWAMITEWEKRYTIGSHPGAIRFLAWLNEADMASYGAATAILKAQGPGADISPARAFRYKYGFGLNWEQEITKSAGAFSRLGWNDGHNESWTFSDVNWTASLGVSVKGNSWNRPDDCFGLAGIVSGASQANQNYLEAGGADLTDGDGALTYRPEKVLETYYSWPVCAHTHATLDYQFVMDPAFNRDRGPVSIFGARLHFDF
jgi:high affinity Mn2+ porin